jgi:hypothetical protein
LRSTGYVDGNVERDAPSHVVPGGRRMVAVVTDYPQLAADIVEAFERGDVESTWDRHAADEVKWRAPMIKNWWPTLDGMVGTTRQITRSMLVAGDPPVARAVLSGELDEAVVTILFDDAGKITHLGVTDWPLQLGIGNIQIDCPEGTVPDVARLYAALLGIDVPTSPEPNWVVLAKDRRTKPALPFAGQAAEWRAPRWNDPQRQQQVHLELFVRDLAEATAIAERHGAVLVDDGVWADQAGHAIVLEAGGPDDAPAVIGRVVLDCDDPGALASFYQELLGMDVRVEDTPDRVVISDDGAGPMLAFRRVERHVPPRWPDPAYPQQMHMDLKFEDFHGAKRIAERGGATRLPPPAPWSHPDVYADPAGHPFCLCFPGQ